MTLDHLRRIADRLDHAIARQGDVLSSAREAGILAMSDASDFAGTLIAAQDHATAIGVAAQAEADLRSARTDVIDRIMQAELAIAPSERRAA